MKKLTLFLAILIAGCATNPDAAKVQSVQVLSKLPQDCKFVRWQECESRRKNGERRCYSQLQKMAVKAGADTVLVDELANKSEVIQLDNNAFGVEKTVVEARLYRCNEAPST